MQTITENKQANRITCETKEELRFAIRFIDNLKTQKKIYNNLKQRALKIAKDKNPYSQNWEFDEICMAGVFKLCVAFFSYDYKDEDSIANYVKVYFDINIFGNEFDEDWDLYDINYTLTFDKIENDLLFA